MENYVLFRNIVQYGWQKFHRILRLPLLLLPVDFLQGAYDVHGLHGHVDYGEQQAQIYT